MQLRLRNRSCAAASPIELPRGSQEIISIHTTERGNISDTTSEEGERERGNESKKALEREKGRERKATREREGGCE